MKLRLSELEIRAIGALCTREYVAKELAVALAVTKPSISYLLKSLENKRLIAIERKGKEKKISLSHASHAQAFRQLQSARSGTHPEKWLSGAALDLLTIAAVPGGISLFLLKIESKSEEATIYRTLSKLASAGVINRSKGQITISDPLVFEFVDAYADNLHFKMLESLKESNNFSLRIRKRILIRTDSKKVPDNFTETGLNRLINEGLDALKTDYSDYYANLVGIKREPVLEEAFIHALLLTTAQQGQNKPLLAVFLSKNRNRLDPIRLSVYAEWYSFRLDLKSTLNELQQAVGYSEKIGSYA